MTGRRQNRANLALLGAVLCTLAPGAALAAEAKGSATAEVVAPAQIVPLAYLRFGAFTRPTTAGTETVSTTGAVTGTGGMASNLSLAQSSGGRGAASFQLNGSAYRLFLVTLPGTTTISSGAATMQVSDFTSDAGTFGIGVLGALGQDTLNVGGTLNVSANQAPGNYSGTFTLTVYYL
ncbi:uncharacterized protein DUF4402 [Novosphingobium sp. PhB165]|uniref:DUF4402 domain-containing protein n=1 Tax=Novosphingobium sp. PhB165 TaxID=2485105 RepID=UPI00104DDC8A|nr:DUF4402 domain-containing protein [Novosphingobium sp. PhB165]TCM19786.1 uncharacterized protein DUF4402 [Novosphingobium sp. PhB165]